MSRKRESGVIFIAVLLMAIMFACCAFAEGIAWNCPECGRTGNKGNYCGACGHAAPTSDVKKKGEIQLPYGLRPGMTIEEADQCMKTAGFKFNYAADNGETIYYHGSVVQGAEAYSTLMSVFSDRVTHVIHFFKEDGAHSRANPSSDYLRIESMLMDTYGEISYSIPNGSNGWKNDSIEIHFGYLESNGEPYYALAYWYLPDNIAYPGF